MSFLLLGTFPDTRLARVTANVVLVKR